MKLNNSFKLAIANNPDLPVRTGYTFSGWVKSDPFNGSLNNAVYTFGAEDDATDVLTASWTANSYTLHFDPNDGKEQAPIDDITIIYDQNVTLPDVTGRYIVQAWQTHTAFYPSHTCQSIPSNGNHFLPPHQL